MDSNMEHQNALVRAEALMDDRYPKWNAGERQLFVQRLRQLPESGIEMSMCVPTEEGKVPEYVFLLGQNMNVHEETSGEIVRMILTCKLCGYRRPVKDLSTNFRSLIEHFQRCSNCSNELTTDIAHSIRYLKSGCRPCIKGGIRLFVFAQMVRECAYILRKKNAASTATTEHNNEETIPETETIQDTETVPTETETIQETETIPTETIPTEATPTETIPLEATPETIPETTLQIAPPTTDSADDRPKIVEEVRIVLKGDKPDWSFFKDQTYLLANLYKTLMTVDQCVLTATLKRRKKVNKLSDFNLFVEAIQQSLDRGYNQEELFNTLEDIRAITPLFQFIPEIGPAVKEAEEMMQGKKGKMNDQSFFTTPTEEDKESSTTISSKSEAEPLSGKLPPTNVAFPLEAEITRLEKEMEESNKSIQMHQNEIEKLERQKSATAKRVCELSDQLKETLVQKLKDLLQKETSKPAVTPDEFSKWIGGSLTELKTPSGQEETCNKRKPDDVVCPSDSVESETLQSKGICSDQDSQDAQEHKRLKTDHALSEAVVGAWKRCD